MARTLEQRKAWIRSTRSYRQRLELHQRVHPSRRPLLYLAGAVMLAGCGLCNGLLLALLR